MKIGIVATTANAATDAADALRKAGIRSILTLVPIEGQSSGGPHVRLVDVANELQILDFYRRAAEWHEES